MSRARTPGGAAPQVAITLPVYPRAHARVSPSSGTAAWQTGDYKISAQTADHPDPQGGTWYLCDGSAVPVDETTLIALIGANLPDAPGRALVMKGTHSDVDAIGDSDGLAVANRRPKHNTTLTDPGHGHKFRWHNLGTTFSGLANLIGIGATSGRTQSDGTPYFELPASSTVASETTGITAAAAGGSGGSDQPAYIVPGNLFIHS